MLIGAFCFILTFFETYSQTELSNINNEFKEIGKIATRKSLDIEISELGIGGEVLDRDLNNYDAYKGYLGDLGAKRIRLQSGWAKTEKTKGVYDFDWLDHIVDDALSQGVQPWIQISYGNPIYPGGGGVSLGQGMIVSEEALAAFESYTKELVSHFKDRVNEWEIWNEADLKSNIDLGQDHRAYAKLFIRTSEAVKSVQSNARIAALSIAHLDNTDYVDGFFKYLKERNKVDLVDIITFHGYPQNPDDNFDNVDKLVAASEKYKSNMEFWQGETGCPSSFGSTGALGKYPWTEHSQAKWDLRRALAHTGRGYKFSLFLLSEFVYNDALRKGLNTKGLLKINENDMSVEYAKPAYYAYQNLCSVFGQKLTFSKNLIYSVKSDFSLSVFGWTNPEGKNIIAYWKNDEIPSDKNNFFNIDILLKNFSFEDPVLVDLFSGKVFEIPKECYASDNSEVTFKKLPCYDSPLIVTEKELISITNDF